MALRRIVERRIHQTVHEDYRNCTQWKRPLQGRQNYWERFFHAFLGRRLDTETEGLQTWTDWLSLIEEFGRSWHVMLNLKQTESSKACDVPVERSKRSRDDNDPWNVAWSSDTHRRLELWETTML